MEVQIIEVHLSIFSIFMAFFLPNKFDDPIPTQFICCFHINSFLYIFLEFLDFFIFLHSYTCFNY